MEQYKVKINSVGKVTHDVLKILTEKPPEYHFTPGQATEIAISQPGWDKERRPFTFTSLPDDDYLEFTIKTYPSHKGVTNKLLQLKVGDELIVHDAFGAITYKGEGVFIAGGAGVTPFISIFRFLHAKNRVGANKLICANKTKADIILKHEFESLLGSNFINILSGENAEGYANGYITEAFLKENINILEKRFYICGPEPMMDATEELLSNLSLDTVEIIKERF